MSYLRSDSSLSSIGLYKTILSEGSFARLRVKARDEGSAMIPAHACDEERGGCNE